MVVEKTAIDLDLRKNLRFPNLFSRVRAEVNISYM